MAVTLRDLAQALGLSITTVSRALAGYDDVAEETRRRVRQAAEEMGYVPNLLARRLQRRRTETLGFVLPTSGPRFADPFFSTLLAGIGDEAARWNYDLLVSTRPPGAEEVEVYRRLTQGGLVDGLFLVRIRREDWRIRFLLDQAFPFVCYGRSDVAGDYLYVGVDGAAGMEVLTRHLLDRGHRRIAFLKAPSDLFLSHDRFAGYRRALEEAGLPLEPELLVEGDLTQAGGYRAVRRLLAGLPPARWPTALIASNDLMALGAMRAFREAGLTVGRDVAVAGFDDIPQAEHSHPPLTTVRQPIYEIGGRACRMLLQVLHGEAPANRQVVLQPELVLRESTEAL